MADDGIVPVGDIKRPVGSHAHFDRTEDVVFCLDDVGEQLGGVETGFFIVVQGVLLEGVAVVTTDDGAALHLVGEVGRADELEPDLLDGGEEKIEGAGIDGEITADETGGAVIPANVGSALVKGLAVIGRDNTPAVRSGGGPLEEGIEVTGAGAQAPESGAVEGLDAVGSLDARVDVVALGEPQFTAESPVEAVDHLVRIGRAEAAEDDAAGVGHVIAVGVAEVKQFGALGDVESSVAEFDPAGHEEALDEFVELVRFAVAVGVLADEDVVIGLFSRLDLRVARGAGDPETAAFVPADLDGLDDPVGLGGKKIHGKSVEDLERGELFVGRLRFRGGLLDGDGGTDGNGRGRLSGEGGADIGLGQVEEREELLHFLGEKAFVPVFPVARVGHIGAVAGEEGPVHGTPVVEPEPLEFEDLVADGSEAVVGRGAETEAFGDTRGDAGMACGIELEAVVGEGLFAAGERREVDVGNFQGRGELTDRVGVKGEVGVVHGEVFGEGVGRFLKGQRRDEDEAATAIGEVSDEGLVGFEKGGETVFSAERFHLAELRDDNGDAGLAELLPPVALLPPARRTGLGLDALLGGAAFFIELLDVASVTPLLEDSVPFPPEVTDAHLALGKGSDEPGLEVGVKAGPLHVRSADEGDGVGRL